MVEGKSKIGSSHFYETLSILYNSYITLAKAKIIVKSTLSISTVLKNPVKSLGKNVRVKQ